MVGGGKGWCVNLSDDKETAYKQYLNIVVATDIVGKRCTNNSLFKDFNSNIPIEWIIVVWRPNLKNIQEIQYYCTKKCNSQLTPT